MPIREYAAKDPERGCPRCREGFERVEPVDCPPFPVCPWCGTPVVRRPPLPRCGRSRTGLERRAKEAGFSAFRRLGRGEYGKMF